VGGWNRFVNWFFGLFTRKVQKAECEILVEVIDRRTGETWTADGKAFAIGVENTDSASMIGGIFGAGGSSEYDNPDIEAAIRRAVVRTVNNLVKQIPEGYFYHEPTFGPARAEPEPAPQVIGSAAGPSGG
jgi:curli biogenesis system outer membrane secretion channel CsgG